MKFFVPGAKNDEDAQQVYQAVKKFVTETQIIPLDDRGIFSIEYINNETQYDAEGDRLHALNGEPVIAILKAKDYGLYYVCTLDRGVAKGSPILVNERHTISTVDFAD